MSLTVSYDEVQEMGADSGGGIIFHYQGQPLTGIIQEFLNGVLVSESEFTDGHEGGIQRQYYLSGQIKQEYTIRFNKLEGTFTEWDESGNITSITTWQNGIQIN